MEIALSRRILQIVLPVSLLIFHCCTQYTQKDASEWYLARTICEWVDNDIYFISPYDEYSLRKYDVLNDSIYKVMDLSNNNAVVGLILFPENSCYHIVEKNISVEWFWFGNIPELHTITTIVDKFWADFQQKINKSTLLEYDTEKQQWSQSITFMGDCIGVIKVPNIQEDIVLNTIFWDLVTVRDTGYPYTQHSRLVASYDSSVIMYQLSVASENEYSFKKQINGTIALGYLPDTSLLVLRLLESDSNKISLYRMTQNEDLEFYYLIKCKLENLTSLKLLPLTTYLTWYDYNDKEVTIYNIIGGKSISLPALSNSYCFSPDRLKIAFFIYDNDKRKLKIDIVPMNIDN